jgi:hypothetical protein
MVVGFTLTLMLKVLFKLLLRPELVAVHVQAYADLLAEESGLLMRFLRIRFLVCAIGAGSLLLSAMWSGVALLLWCALPVVDHHRAWVLWALPLTGLALSLVCWGVFRLLDRSVFFPRTREQIQLDALALRQVSQA